MTQPGSRERRTYTDYRFEPQPSHIEWLATFIGDLGAQNYFDGVKERLKTQNSGLLTDVNLAYKEIVKSEHEPITSMDDSNIKNSFTVGATLTYGLAEISMADLGIPIVTKKAIDISDSAITDLYGDGRILDGLALFNYGVGIASRDSSIGRLCLDTYRYTEAGFGGIEFMMSGAGYVKSLLNIQASIDSGRTDPDQVSRFFAIRSASQTD